MLGACLLCLEAGVFFMYIHSVRPGVVVLLWKIWGYGTFPWTEDTKMNEASEFWGGVLLEMEHLFFMKKQGSGQVLMEVDMVENKDRITWVS